MSEVIDAVEFEHARDRAIEHLRAGELVVLPTDTAYAVVADAFRPDATLRLSQAKHRDRKTPLGVVIRNPRQVAGLVSDVSEAADRLMAAYWPGPLTLVLAATDGLTWDLGQTRGTVSLRLPTDDLLLAVIAEIGPLACTGANVDASPVPTSMEAAREQLGDEVALYVDGGVRGGPLSTVVDVSREGVDVLREGAVPADDIEQVAGGELDWGARPDSQAPSGQDAADPAAPGEEPEGTTTADEDGRRATGGRG